MELAWIVLVLVSASIHPLRDLVLKGVAHPLPCYIGVTILWIVLAFLQTLMSGQSLALPVEVWPLIGVSSVGLVLYYYGTLSALQRGDLSVYYPVVRSSPMAIVVLSAVLLDQQYSWVALVGISLVILGGLMIQKPEGGIADDGRALVLAIIAMVGSAGYTLSDSVAMRVVSPAPFLFHIYVLVSLMLSVILVWENAGSGPLVRRLTDSWQAAPWRVLFAGVTSYLSYLLILTAFQIGAEAAVVSAARQVSIPISVALAAFVLNESRFLGRLGWASLITLGILCLVLV